MDTGRKDRAERADDPEERRPASELETMRRALERICFLEWRLEQLEAALGRERAALSEKEQRLAEGLAREAGQAGRLHALTERLAALARENALYADRLLHAEGRRSAAESRLAGAMDGPAADRAPLHHELLAERLRADEAQRTLRSAEDRLVALERAQERFFARLVHWQTSLRSQDHQEIDLAEFISELRAEIARLSAENVEGQQREEDLRRRLVEAAAGSAMRLAHEAPAPAGLAQPQAEPRSGFVELQGLQISSSQPDPRELHQPTPRDDAEHASMLEAPEALEPEPPARLDPAPELGLEDARRGLDALPDPLRRRSALRFLEELSGRTQPQRLAAARGLRTLAGEASAPALARALGRATEVSERMALLAELAQTATPLAARALIDAGGDPEPSIRIAAIEASARLAQQAPELARSMIAGGLADEDRRVRRRAVLAAASAMGLDAAETLGAGLTDEDPEVRRAIASLLSGTRAPAGRRALLGALLDPVLAVRGAAVTALERCLGASLGGLATAPEQSRREAVRTLKARLLEGGDTEETARAESGAAHEASREALAAAAPSAERGRGPGRPRAQWAGG
jgi:hypothetical protein